MFQCVIVYIYTFSHKAEHFSWNTFKILQMLACPLHFFLLLAIVQKCHHFARRVSRLASKSALRGFIERLVNCLRAKVRQSWTQFLLESN